MTDREIMEWSLEYLIEFGMGEMPTAKALRDRLAQPEPEPVAWRYKIVPPAWTYSDKQPNPEFAGSAWERWQVQPLYAAPPEPVNWDAVDKFYENKLKPKEKNT